MINPGFEHFGLWITKLNIIPGRVKVFLIEQNFGHPHWHSPDVGEGQ